MAPGRCLVEPEGVITQPLEVLAIACSKLSDPRTMCAALCTSSSARQAILDKCSGTLQLQLQPKRVEGTEAEKAEAALSYLLEQAAWLAEHSSMVGQLQLRCPDTAAGAAEAAMQLALRPPLQLQSLQLLKLKRPAAVLRHLDPSRLTKLLMNVLAIEQQVLASPLLAAALGRLTGLQELAITNSWKTVNSSMGAALAVMPHLTQLVLQPQLPAAALARLPSQLVELQLSNPQCEAAQLVAHVKALQQLQSLTLLYCSESLQRGQITSHAVAWPALSALKRLDLDIWSGDEDFRLSVGIAAGIAGATSLTRLYCWFVEDVDADVELVTMLSPLKQLQSLDLSTRAAAQFDFGGLLSGSLSGLKSLSLSLGPLPPLALFQLCYEARQLTQLVLEDAAVSDAMLEKIARSMKGLRQLALCSCCVSMAGVVAALTLPHLPDLRQLVFVADGLAGAFVEPDLSGLRVDLQRVRPALHVVAVHVRQELSKVADELCIQCNFSEVVAGAFAYTAEMV